jgi:octanoyl-[GcvH]:protein N-octanoyltransferase
VELHTDAAADPALDVAISHALLAHAAQDGVGSLRIWRPVRGALSLGRLDVRGPSLRALSVLARSAGLEPVARLAGGRAAALDPGCLCLGLAEPTAGLQDPAGRYRFVAGAVIDALRALGVASELGEAPGEWCPGAWSVQGPAGKLAGLAQRVISGGAWCEALVVIERSPALRALTERIHELSAIPWRADAQGELGALLDGHRDVHAALQAALTQQFDRHWPGLRVAPLPAGARERALLLRAEHQLP